MGNTQDKGVEGERVAREYLEKSGLQFITSNWSWKTGEIDLIFQDATTRVFVEVRSRSETTFGEGLETVYWQKQQKLIKTARMYQVKENYWGDARFDVISIIFRPQAPPTITHIKDAFDTASI
ncbi:MAG TPA: YraN family protein [Candidatus Andersenbacteria bacterium]|nr:YraN family protein [Candidatus Andersenbacteria bacterium]